MNGFLGRLIILLAYCGYGFAAPPTVRSLSANKDVPLDTNTASPFWRAAVPVYMDGDAYGHPVPKYRTEVRLRWTKKNLYVLFVCPYEQLNLNPNPKTSTETYELWDWDVAEIFIGADFKDIKRYKEFEVSPQGEWIDLDIDLHKSHHEEGWTWNSGFQVSARIERDAHVWYAAMKIPYSRSTRVRPPPGTFYGSICFAARARNQAGMKSRGRLRWQTLFMCRSDLAC